ncbi:MDR family oxidoreductase [Falsirhodobacter sp. alg1]|uniref:MDR family oxidoreductase n=1 Tax=Falsirhodobacter sp. alg1 TaxID=1472418 RepID=UPI000786EB4D|nr:MDR family oxidoreductase [Falsirhodobacter sp. alg1]
MTEFRALLMNGPEGAQLCTLTEADLPEGDVTVAVEYSSLNYKDGMVLMGQGGLAKTYPHVPGVDLAGRVAASDDPRFAVGDPVILTGWHVGERHWGGYAGRARVRGDWLVHLPDGLSLRDAMLMGTAGFTAMQAVVAMDLPPESDVVVTGASGGVGSVAVALLSALGHCVTAISGRDAKYLQDLGAAEVIARKDWMAERARPLAPKRWAGAIDTVGGEMLARVLSSIADEGAVASVGLAGGTEATVSMMPFLLRGVKLLGINSVTCPAEQRAHIWRRIATDMPMAQMKDAVTEVGLDALTDLAPRILSGEVRGRTIVRLGDA